MDKAAALVRGKTGTQRARLRWLAAIMTIAGALPSAAADTVAADATPATAQAPARQAATAVPPPPAAAESPVRVEVFQAARLVDPVPPPYPASARRNAREGWVLLDCVVDASGALTHVAVRDSSGQPEFETAALAWMSTNRIEPARLGDQPVESALPYKATFRMHGEEPGARLSFTRRYREFQDAIARKDRAAADAALAQLDVQNLYEDAFRNMAHYFHATQWGDERAQVRALRGAIAHERHARYLPERLFAAATRQLFLLLLRQSDYGAALAIHALLDKTTQADPAIASAMARLNALAAEPTPFRVQGEVDARGFWSTRLLTSRFRIEPTTGQLTQFRLHCERRHVFMPLDPSLVYTRAPGAGNCDILVLGSVGATFALVQM